jgi:hypothetical protein
MPFISLLKLCLGKRRVTPAAQAESARFSCRKKSTTEKLAKIYTSLTG